MGCNCKNSKIEDTSNKNDGVLSLFFNTILFLITLPFAILIASLGTIYAMFKVIVLDSNKFNIMGAILKVINKNKTKRDTYDDELEDELEYHLTDVDYIKN